ncbi:hypothetical protein ARMGADRAFT_1143824 [Armillaria gallica]|uniref:Uncharacterized protein n=1 Tax=Armillaria gallica TaxID=47427 RepID=A0A2H3CFM1_ARMGA|nr:hypothetical protein ARMGADRAFT_1143824 [Armillaria gallica]
MTTLPLHPFFSHADLFFRARNSTVMSSSNINTVRSVIVSTLKQRTITFPIIARILSLSFNIPSSVSGILRWIAELEVVVVVLKGIQAKHHDSGKRLAATKEEEEREHTVLSKSLRVEAYNASAIISDVAMHFEPCQELIRPYVYLFNSLMELDTAPMLLAGYSDCIVQFVEEHSSNCKDLWIAVTGFVDNFGGEIVRSYKIAS